MNEENPSKDPRTFDGVICFGGEDWWNHNRGHYDMQMMRELGSMAPVLYVNSIGMRLPALKEGAVLINTGRGSLIDETALHRVLSSGGLAAAALDVYQNEPYKPQSEAFDLRKLPNVLLTPHVASNTRESNHRMADSVMQNINSFIEGRYGDLTRVD